MCRKGFTLLELTIVFVVIGLILGMAVKGKTLVDSAKVRVEVIKMGKFETAVYTYFSKTNNSLPPLDTTTGRYDTTSLITTGALGPHDYYSEMANDNWTLVACGIQPAGFSVAISGPEICARIGASDHMKVPARLVCSIEKMLDDDDLSTGNGRVQGGAVNFTQEVYDDCSLASGGPYDYMYLVF